MWYPVLAQQEVLAKRKQVVFLLVESVLMAVPLAVSSALSQVQTVPCWQGLVQATVALPALLSQQSFLLPMFPAHAQIDFFAIGEQFAAFHESPKLDVGAAVQVRQRSVYALAFLAACRLPEEWASP